MAISTRSYAQPFLPSERIPPGIKALLISNAAIFIVLAFVRSLEQPVVDYLALTPAAVVRNFMVWQLGTYLFIHTRGMVWLFIWNMLALWMFGGDIERSWGTNRFIRFYLMCGAGAGVCSVLAGYAFGSPLQPVIGALSAINAILAACAALWPDRMILAFFFFPMKLKYYVLIIAGVLFLFSYNGGIADLAQLTGLLFGYLYVRMPKVRGFDPMGSIQSRYKAWKLQRAKRKFQVYLKKQRSDQDRWVN